MRPIDNVCSLGIPSGPSQATDTFCFLPCGTVVGSCPGLPVVCLCLLSLSPHGLLFISSELSSWGWGSDHTGGAQGITPGLVHEPYVMPKMELKDSHKQDKGP